MVWDKLYLIVALVLMHAATFAEGLNCYFCWNGNIAGLTNATSDLGPFKPTDRCGKGTDFSLTPVDSSYILSSFLGMDCKACTYSTYSDGKSNIVGRSCAAIEMEGCQDPTTGSYGGVTFTVSGCACKTDLCNAATKATAHNHAIIFIFFTFYKWL